MTNEHSRGPVLRGCLTAFAVLLAGSVYSQSGSPAITGPLSLRKAIELGLMNSPVDQGSLADVNASKASVNAARARTLPHISANTFGTVGSYSSILASSPGVDPLYNLAVPSGAFLDQNLMLMWPLFTGGTLEHAVGSAERNREAAQADARETKLNVSLSIIEAYLKVLQHTEMQRAETARVEAAQELVRTTTVQVNVGEAVPASLQRVEAELAQAKRSLATEQNEGAKGLLMLLQTMGADLGSDVQLTDNLRDHAPAKTLDQYLKSAPQSRGAVVAARARTSAAQADLHAAQGQYAPQLYGVAMGDVTSRGQVGRGATAGLTLSFPLFDAGQRRADVDKAKAMVDKATAGERSALLNVQREVREAWLDLQTAEANLASARASVTATEEAYKVMHLRVLNGKSILLEELDALQTLTRARADLAQALYDHEIALARLLRAAGQDDLLTGEKQ